MRADDRRRAVIALGASALLHLAAGVLLLRAARSPIVPRRVEPPLEIALVERPPGPIAPRPSGDAAAPAASGAKVASKRRGPPRRTPPAEPGSQGRPVAGPATRGGASPSPGTREWLEAEGLSPGEAVGPPGFLGPVHGGDVATGDGPAAAPPEPERDPERLRARIDGWFQEQLATDRARNLPDAYWSGVKEKLDDGMKVAWEVLDQGPADDAVVSGNRVGQAMVAWQREAERWARQGQPRLPPDPDDRALAEARTRLAAHDLLGSPGRQAELFLTELVTRVEIEQGPDGAPPACRLLASSGNAAHDELVMGHVRRVVERLRDGLGTPGYTARTEWSVRTRFIMIPPYPIVGCGFDAQFHFAGCTYPLKRIVRSSVKLDRVWLR